MPAPGIKSAIALALAASSLAITHVANVSSTANASSYTFSSAALGNAAADRTVIVAVAGSTGSTPAINSVTIAGVTATLARAQASTTIAGLVTALYYASIPSGTTGNIVVTFNKTMGSCACSIFRMVGATSTTPAATGADGTGSTTSDPNCNVASGDVVVAASCGTDGTACAWTGATEASDLVAEQANLSAAIHSATTTQTPRALKAVHTAGQAVAAVSAAWR